MTDREALIKIGNIVGAPQMGYCPDIEIAEWRNRAQKISALIVEQLAPKSCVVTLAADSYYCPRCGMHVTVDGTPDPKVYSVEWIKKWTSKSTPDQRCTHRR